VFKEKADVHYDVVLFDLPGTMGSDGVIATISALDYLFVPIKADRLVLESTLNFATTVNDRLIKTGISNRHLASRISHLVTHHQLYDSQIHKFTIHKSTTSHLGS
jgi:cellulose biosynthesis protein BcsQ